MFVSVHGQGYLPMVAGAAGRQGGTGYAVAVAAAAQPKKAAVPDWLREALEKRQAASAAGKKVPDWLQEALEKRQAASAAGKKVPDWLREALEKRQAASAAGTTLLLRVFWSAAGDSEASGVVLVSPVGHLYGPNASV